MEEEQAKVRNKSWLSTFQYLRRLRHGPPPDELEVMQLLNSFYEFLVVQMLALQIHGMPPERRKEYVDGLRKNWKRSLRRYINDQVKKHEAVLNKAPDGHLLRTFIGDGENMRMDSNLKIREADKKVEEMLDRLIEQVENAED